MLTINFNTKSDYNTAKKHFIYDVHDENDEFRTLSFEKTPLDTLEQFLATELVQIGIENFYFTAE